MDSGPGSGSEVAAVIIIDPMDFRRAGVASLLQSWAGPRGYGIHAMGCAPPPAKPHVPSECGILVLSIGHWSLKEALVEEWAQSLSATVPSRPVVIMSEREEVDEAIAAFRLGACAFMPMSVDPAIALHAFTFVAGGGTYFPPTLLHRVNELHAKGLSLEHTQAIQVSSQPRGLTSRQQEVLSLLRQGRSNKVIARALSMQEATVKVHVRQILRKLGASHRTQAALIGALDPYLPAAGYRAGDKRTQGDHAL
jgi:DNA-binding NarL/FixJ family response regulator